MDFDFMAQVADDPDATAADVVDAGRGDRVARASDGSVVITYSVEASTDCDECDDRSAWRLYDGYGRHLAEGLGTTGPDVYVDVVAVGNVFRSHLNPDHGDN